MNKDVIYIDVEDDITAIIGKIKASKEKIVALVPPKRTGVLQSAVNLRLLERMAGEAEKKLVVITGNKALMHLAGSAGIPVARTLQSKPEIATAEAEAVDEAEDVIDGDQLPVGDHAEAAGIPVKDNSSDKAAKAAKVVDKDKAVESLSIDDLEVPVQVAAVSKDDAPAKSSKIKIPNFDKFRKRIFIGVAVLILLIGFLVWANVFAPAATIVITARTTATPVSADLTLGDNLTTNDGTSTLKTVTKQLKQDQTVQFTPTGQKDIGDKASGTMNLTRTSVSSSPLDVPAGTTFTSNNGHVFTSTKDVSLAGTQIGPHGLIQDQESVPVTANATGTDYNLSAQSYQPSEAGMSAQGSAMTGGTPANIVNVVSDDDISKATTQLTQQSTSSYQSQLQKQFGSDYVVIGDSFTATPGTPTSSPASGQQASGQATLTATTTYSLSAVSKSDLEGLLKANITANLDSTKDQRIYDDGVSKVSFSDYTPASDGTNATATATTTGQVGPNIDDNTIKKESEGKIFGEVQSNLQAINGVDNVNVKFSYFWVSTVPNDPNKIRIEFQLEND